MSSGFAPSANMGDKYAVFESDTAAKERVARNLAIAPDAHAALDLNKCAHLGSIANHATVQVDQTGLVNHHVPAEADIFRYHAN